MLHVGDSAPRLTLLDQDGREYTLSDESGRTIVLYFYPKADTRINSAYLS